MKLQKQCPVLLISKADTEVFIPRDVIQTIENYPVNMVELKQALMDWVAGHI